MGSDCSAVELWVIGHDPTGRSNRNKSGGGKGIRTLDPSVANAVLSQLSYAPTQAVSNQRSAISQNQKGKALY